MEYCNCHNTLSMKEALTGLVDEVKELVEEPSKDELSDVVYCINRIAGTLTKKPYLKVIGGDTLHIVKIKERMNNYGCIRSPRHLINGQCPSK